MDWPVIREPLHVHGVRTPAEYAKQHERHLARLRLRGLNVVSRLETPGATVIVNGGNAIVFCMCGGGASASREWDEARCFDCGAIYQRLDWPDDWDEVVDTLLARPQAQRSHGVVIAPGEVLREETVSVLKAENVVLGVAESKRDAVAAVAALSVKGRGVNVI